jgi:hypothetical protein
MAAQAPGEIGLISGWRSHETQAQLHAQKPGLAAEPGHSNHEFGLAIDMSFENAATRNWVHQNAARFGLWFPMDYEPWHVQLIGVDRHNVGGIGQPVGGGRNAFSLSPDGRFVNPYDALSGRMGMEDNTDPVTQFERLISAFTNPHSFNSMLASPGMKEMASPTGGSAPDLTSAATTVATGAEFQQATPADHIGPT